MGNCGSLVMFRVVTVIPVTRQESFTAERHSLGLRDCRSAWRRLFKSRLETGLESVGTWSIMLWRPTTAGDAACPAGGSKAPSSVLAPSSKARSA